MNRFFTLAAAAAVAALPLSAKAQSPQPMGSGDATPSRATLEASFQQADTDSDTRLSKTEIGAMKGWSEKLAVADTDKDGIISMLEFMAAHGTK